MPSEVAQTFTPHRGLTLRDPQSSAPYPDANPPKRAKLEPGVSLTLEKVGAGQIIPKEL